MYNKNFSKEPTDKQKLGAVGEDSACKWLESRGYRILERNYLKKWGEIDIIAKNKAKIHFIEVKAVSKDLSDKDVTHVTSDGYRAEDSIHYHKLERLGRTIQSYLLDRDVSDETEWQFDVVIVWVDMSKRLSRVFLLEDIII